MKHLHTSGKVLAFLLSALFLAAILFVGCSDTNNNSIQNPPNAGGEEEVPGSGDTDGNEDIGDEETPGGNGESSGSGGDTEDPGTSIVVSEKSGVMLQGFNWESASRLDKSKQEKWYGYMQAQAAKIANTFAYVWMPPPSPSESSSPEGYLPTEWNSLDNAYGTEAELKTFIQSISPAKAIADVVVNHRNGYMSWGQFANPSLCKAGHTNCYDSKCTDFSAIASNDEGFTDSTSEMYNAATKGAADSGESYNACRDLDHTNTNVQAAITTWMKDVLNPAGFVGWRYDFVKGFEGKYVGQYNKAATTEFSVGEYWPSAGYNSSNPGAWGNEIKNWVSATESGGQRSRAFDFALKGAMNTVFGNNSSNVSNSNYALLADSSNLMMSQSADAVTFIDNHDTGSTQQHWYLDPADIGTAYAFILTHPGYPCVAWQHYFTDAESGGYNDSQYIGGNTVPGTSNTYRKHIDYLIGLRGRVGVEYDDTVVTEGTNANCYVGKITGNNGELLVKIGGVTAPTEEGYSGNNPIYAGTDFAIWEKGVNGIDKIGGSGSGGSGSGGGNQGGNVPSTGDVILTVTGPDWTWNTTTIFCWAWNDSAPGSWYTCTGTGTTIYATVPSDATKFLIVRCHYGTETPDWDMTTAGLGRIYNKTDDITINSGQTNYTVEFVNYPSTSS